MTKLYVKNGKMLVTNGKLRQCCCGCSRWVITAPDTITQVGSQITPAGGLTVTFTYHKNSQGSAMIYGPGVNMTDDTGTHLFGQNQLRFCSDPIGDYTDGTCTNTIQISADTLRIKIVPRTIYPCQSSIGAINILSVSC